MKIEGSDGKLHAPQERSRYMLAFAPHGEISARIDCNRGSGTWSANDSGQLQFGGPRNDPRPVPGKLTL